MRVISQQAINIVGDKTTSSGEWDNFRNNFYTKPPRGSNFENFISMAGHYGSNRQATNSNVEGQKHMDTHEKSLSKNGKSTLSNNILSTDETKSNYNYLCLPSSNDRTGRNTSIEELKTNKCPSNHSPLLTKRKNSQKKGGNSTVRNKHKQQKNKSKFVSLNGNLRSSSSHAHEDGKSTER